MSSRRPVGTNVVLTAAAAAALRDEFVAWQCRLRQFSARAAGGRPLPGMRPRVLSPQGDELSPAVTTLIHEAEPEDSTQMFRFQYQKTNNPIERYDKILEILAAGHYQQPDRFTDVMTALFGPTLPVVAALLNHGRCVLEFVQEAQNYRLPCAVRELETRQALYQATYWHNRMFNPNLPPGIRILSFAPDWPHATAWIADPE